MKKNMSTEAQIAFVLKRAEDGASIAEVCRKAFNKSGDAVRRAIVRYYGALD